MKGDFWGWGRFAPTDGRTIENRGLRLLRADAQTAEIAIRNDWNIQGRKALDESTTAKVSERQGARILDLQYRFGSDAAVTLNQMAFTGLCLRCRKDGQAYFSDTQRQGDAARLERHQAGAELAGGRLVQLHDRAREWEDHRGGRDRPSCKPEIDVARADPAIFPEPLHRRAGTRQHSRRAASGFTLSGRRP